MAERTALLYQMETSENAIDSLSEDFAAVGLSLVHPRSGQVMLLDDEGEQVPASKEELRGRIASSVSFQWWFAEDHAVYCRIRVSRGVRIIELGLEGCHPAELAAIGGMLGRRFMRGTPKSIGLVFDPEGVSEGYDWDRFFLDHESIDWRDAQIDFPEMIGISRPALERLEHVPADAKICTEDELVLVSRRD
jgi:hypothetical protein